MTEGADPIEYFLEDMSYHGRSDRTIRAYERVLRQFESYVTEERDVEGVHAATHRDCLAWIDRRRGAVADSTVASYASYLHRFFSYMVEVGTFESNPMTLVVEEMDERIDTDPSRRDVSVPEMRSFVADLGHPGDRAIVLTLLKTGMRAGELCNLDLRDVALSDVSVPTGPTRPALEGRPDSIYVSADPTAGEVTNGDRRTESNKRKRDTVVPVDEELDRALEAWLAIRPDPISDADPLFVSTGGDWGRRVTGSGVHHLVTSHAEERGWYDRGDTTGANVTPHYFRHFFTTHLRDRTGDRGIVKYLRGDVASDVIDTYTHNWGDRVRAVYESHIYRMTER